MDKNYNKLLEEIKYGVDNSNIMSVLTNYRFTKNITKYIYDYPYKFEKDIEEFKKN